MFASPIASLIPFLIASIARRRTRRPRRTARSLPFALASLLAAFLLAPPASTAQSIAVSKDNRTVSVTATEHITVLADVATVHVGYIVFGRDRDTAYGSATTLSGAIIKALTDSGVTLESIESDSQGIEPVQNFQVERLSPADAANHRYQVQQSWLVHVAAPDAGKALDTAVLAGANQSGQIDWSLKDENAATSSAAARAIERAHRVASQMVSPFGGKLGPLLYASNESESSTIRPMAMQAMHKMANSSEPLAISPRRIERSVTVRAIFAVE